MVGGIFKGLVGICVLSVFVFLGVKLQAAGLALPGPVIGLVLLAAALAASASKSGARKGLLGLREALTPVAKYLIKHMGLLFVPAGVGVVTQLDLLRRHWPAIAVALFVSTLLSLIVTGWVMHRLCTPMADSGETA
jgi:putative effector of murein hydrolase LrgA (UPF0299 family)